MYDPWKRAREYLDRRTVIAMLATCTPEGVPDVTVLIAPRFSGDDQVAGGEEKDVAGSTFRNLRRHARATIVALDPIMDPRARDGVRLEVEFLGAEEDGRDLKEMGRWLETFAPGRQVVRRLLFKVLSAEHYRPQERGPVLIE